jgi:hypothetical protein
MITLILEEQSWAAFPAVLTLCPIQLYRHHNPLTRTFSQDNINLKYYVRKGKEHRSGNKDRNEEEEGTKKKGNKAGREGKRLFIMVMKIIKYLVIILAKRILRPL